MKKLYFILFIVLSVYIALPAQSSKFSLKASQAQAFYADVVQSTLVIPISDKKDPEEKALLDAVKKYWTICPYKTISSKVFYEMQNNRSETPPKTYYLLKETYERLHKSQKDWAYSKYFITRQNLWVEEHDEPYIEFKLPIKTVNHRTMELPCGYLFGLMIRHLNAELLLMKDREAYRNSFSRRNLIKANFKSSLKPYAGKTLLVGENELENYMIYLHDLDKDRVRQQEKLIKLIARKTKIDPSNIKMATENEIKTAIEKAGPNTLLYVGFTVYDAKDARILRRIDPNRGAKPFHWMLVISLSAAVVATALVLSGIL
ncbi:MAG TPA: hypothetical protein VF411_14500 [Bacteroidia bacterium]